MWRDSVGEPDETGIRPDGTVPTWQPMPACTSCGAAFAAHVDGRCPQTLITWAPPPRRGWLPRHWLLASAIVLLALLVGVGVGSVSLTSHTSHTSRVAVSQAVPADGNAIACSDFGQLNAVNPYNIGAEAVLWQKLRTAAPQITDPALSAAVAAFNSDLSRGDTLDAGGSASTAIETACAALGYSHALPQPALTGLP
jgi:hypothetical protein